MKKKKNRWRCWKESQRIGDAKEDVSWIREIIIRENLTRVGRIAIEKRRRVRDITTDRRREKKSRGIKTTREWRA